MPPGKDCGLLAKSAGRVASRLLVLQNIGLLEVGSAANQQQLQVVFAALPVQLHGAAQAPAEIMQLFWLGRIQISAGCKAIGEKIIANSPGLPAIVGVQVMVIEGCAAIVQQAMAAHGAPRARCDIEYAAKTVAIFGRESAGQQIHRLKNLRADPRTELWLGVIEKRDSIDEFVQRKLIAAHIDKVVVALAGAGHEVG